jgi:hypothetical protein
MTLHIICLVVDDKHQRLANNAIGIAYTNANQLGHTNYLLYTNNALVSLSTLQFSFPLDSHLVRQF